LAVEIVIQRQSSHDSAFAQSVLGTSLYLNVAHIYTYYTRYVGVDGYRGNDIDAFAAAGGNPHALSATLLAYTTWTLHRMQKRKFLFSLSISTFSAMVVCGANAMTTISARLSAHREKVPVLMAIDASKAEVEPGMVYIDFDELP
jgi:hypothetical protein